MNFKDQQTLPLNRRQAGQALAAKLAEYGGRNDVVVLALPCGGIPVGIEIASQLKVSLDVILVQKLTLPGKQNTTLGAVASGGLAYINRTLTGELGLTEEAIEKIIHTSREEMFHRQRLYPDGFAFPELRDKIVVLADDGMISGSTIYLACCAVRRAGAREVIVAVPVVTPATKVKLAQAASRVVTVVELRQFEPLNGWYFAQRPTDPEAASMLHKFLRQLKQDSVDNQSKEADPDLVHA